MGHVDIESIERGKFRRIDRGVQAITKEGIVEKTEKK